MFRQERRGEDRTGEIYTYSLCVRRARFCKTSSRNTGGCKMLEIQDIQRLFGYIKDLRPNCRAIPRLTESMARAWCDAFQDYEYAQLEAAAAKQSLVNRFWPEPSDIAQFLPPSGGAASVRQGARSDAGQPQDPQVVAWWQGWHTEIQVAGLPTLTEAQESGMSCAEYAALLCKAGL